MDTFGPCSKDETVVSEFAKIEKVLPGMISEVMARQALEPKTLDLPKTTKAQREELCRRVASSSRSSTDRFRFFNNLRFGSNPLGARGLCTAAYPRARAIVVQSAAVDGELDCESRARIGRAVMTSALALATAMLVLAVATLIGNSGAPPILDRDAPPLPHSKPPERRTTPRALTNSRLRRV